LDATLQSLQEEQRRLENRKLLAETLGVELENRWRVGWRGLLKVAIASLVTVSAVWAYFTFYVDLQLKNFDMTKQSAEINEKRSADDLARAKSDLVDVNTQLLKLQGQLVTSKRDHDALVEQSEKLKQQAADFDRNYQALKRNFDEVAGASAAIRKAQQTERERLAAELAATRKALDTTLAKQPTLASTTDLRGASTAHDSSPLDSASSALTPEMINRRKAALDNVFLKYEGRTDFVLASETTPDVIAKEQKKAQLAAGDRVVALVHFIFGDWLVFGTNSIYSRQSSQSKDNWTLRYEDLVGRQFGQAGLWSVTVSPQLEIVTAGTKFKRADIVALLTDLREMVVANPSIFPVSRGLGTGDNP
jgi:hypothetical protein